MTDKVPDIIIDRAVELWCRALKRPTFDNGDNSEHGFIAQGLHHLNADHDLAKVDDFDAAVARFRNLLGDKLKFLRDHNGEGSGVTDSRGNEETYYFERHLGTDYHPDRLLADAAREAGVPLSAFSWKSHVSFYASDSVDAAFGYGAEGEHHYPLSGGRWLVCQLRGEGMPIIIKAVEDGRLPELTVEEPRP